MKTIIKGPTARETFSESGHSMATFWPRSVAIEMSAYLITHPETRVREWLVQQVKNRTQELAVAGAQ